jgi:hypothetical protein
MTPKEMYRYMYQTSPKIEWRQLWFFVAVQDPEKTLGFCRIVQLYKFVCESRVSL